LGCSLASQSRSQQVRFDGLGNYQQGSKPW
jgi:hypothetical protein